MKSYGIPPKPVEMVKVVNYGYQWALKPRLIFKSNLLSVLLYGCKTWRMSKADEKKLDVFLHKSRILKILKEPDTKDLLANSCNQRGDKNKSRD